MKNMKQPKIRLLYAYTTKFNRYIYEGERFDKKKKFCENFSKKD
jgi:hypothetical protein